MNLNKYAIKLFYKRIKKYKDLFKGLKKDLREAYLPYTIGEWLSLTIFYSILGVVFALPISIVFLLLLLKSALSILLAFIVAILAGSLVFSMFYFYPSIKASNRKSELKGSLHYATLYMSTIAGTGAPPYTVFEVLAKFEELGEISKVSKSIVRDIKGFGLDIVDALERRAKRTPSEDLRDLLFGIRTTITSGGNLRDYLTEKSKSYVKAYRRRLKKYTQTLSIFMEMYITVVIVGTVFVLVLSTIMSLMGGFVGKIKTVQLLLVTVGLPFMSAVFVLLLKMMSPEAG